MSGQWAWVTFAYLVFYGTLALFVGSIAWRLRRGRARIEERP